MGTQRKGQTFSEMGLFLIICGTAPRLSTVGSTAVPGFIHGPARHRVWLMKWRQQQSRARCKCRQGVSVHRKNRHTVIDTTFLNA